jgi:hypothetical protein
MITETVCADCGDDLAAEGHAYCLECLEADDSPRRADYRRWHRLQVDTDDLDPVYPVMRLLATAWRLTPDEVAWLIALHVAYYHLGSALAAFSRTEGSPANVPGRPDALVGSPLLSLPCGTERRGHRTRIVLARHLCAVASTHRVGGWSWYAGNGWDWTDLNDRLTGVIGNGRWAAYKTAEMVQKVGGAPLVATDAGHRYSSGPRKGLDLLYDGLPTGQDPTTIRALDLITARLATDDLGEPDVAKVETSLCDFHSLWKGRYYLGHDVDAMMDQLLDPRIPDRTPDAAWAARAVAFDSSLLGEAHGWWGVRPGLKQVYRDHGILDWRRP